MKFSYRTKIVDMRSVEFVGELKYAFTDDLAGWQIKDGSTWEDLDTWLEKFSGERVRVTIELTSPEDDSDLLDDEDEEWRCYDLH